jgi:hypothetical protein
MLKRWLIRLVVAVALAGALVAVWAWVRSAEARPRYPQVKRGMSWEQVEEIFGRRPIATYIARKGGLHKWYLDVEGRVEVSYDEEGFVIDVQYVPDDPNPPFDKRVAKWLRLY